MLNQNAQKIDTYRNSCHQPFFYGTCMHNISIGLDSIFY